MTFYSQGGQRPQRLDRVKDGHGAASWFDQRSKFSAHCTRRWCRNISVARSRHDIFPHRAPEVRTTECCPQRYPPACPGWPHSAPLLGQNCCVVNAYNIHADRSLKFLVKRLRESCAFMVQQMWSKLFGALGICSALKMTTILLGRFTTGNGHCQILGDSKQKLFRAYRNHHTMSPVCFTGDLFFGTVLHFEQVSL